MIVQFRKWKSTGNVIAIVQIGRQVVTFDCKGRKVNTLPKSTIDRVTSEVQSTPELVDMAKRAVENLYH